MRAIHLLLAYGYGPSRTEIAVQFDWDGDLTKVSDAVLEQMFDHMVAKQIGTNDPVRVAEARRQIEAQYANSVPQVIYPTATLVESTGSEQDVR